MSSFKWVIFACCLLGVWPNGLAAQESLAKPESVDPQRPTSLRQPGAAGSRDEVVSLGSRPAYWRAATNRFRGVTLLLDRPSGGLMASHELRGEFARQGWASLLVLVTPQAMELDVFTALLEDALVEAKRRGGEAAGSGSGRVVLAASHALGEWALRAAPDLEVDGLLLRNLPRMMTAIDPAEPSAGEQRSPGATSNAPTIGARLQALSQNLLLVQEQRPPWWLSPGSVPAGQEWQLTSGAARSPHWIARRMRGWQQRLEPSAE